MIETNMTTYDNILDIIIRRQGELNISNRKLAKIVAVGYQTMNNYLSYKKQDASRCDVCYYARIRHGWQSD